MEINKYNEIFFKVGQKYSFSQVDTNSDNELSKEEVLKIAYQDEELCAELSDEDLALIKEIISSDNLKETNKTEYSISEQTSIKVKPDVKTYEEYSQELDTKFNELYEKYNGDNKAITQYVENNREKLLDIDNDGRLSAIDSYVIQRYYSETKKNQNNSDEKSKIMTNFAEKIKGNSHKLKFNITNNTNYDLEDLENLHKVSGGDFRELSKYGVNIKNFINYGSSYFRLDCAKISQYENWEERFDAILEKLGLSNNTESIKKIKEKVQKCAEYIKANPQTADYADLAVEYQTRKKSHEEKIQNGTYKTLAEGIIYKAQEFYEKLKDKSYKKVIKEWYKDAQAQGYAYSFEQYCKEIAYDNYKSETVEDLEKELIIEAEKNLTNQITQRNVDINGDSISNANDYNDFSNNIDLDGDGVVSESEKSYLQNNKNKIEKIYVGINKELAYNISENLTNIDEVISNIDSGLYEKQKESIDNIKKILEEYAEKNNTYDFYLGQRATGSIRAFLSPLLNNNSLDINIDKDKFRKGHLETLYSLFDDAYEYYDITNAYLRYIKTADLSETELIQILDKIYSSSDKVKNKLSEVIELISQKLQNQ